MQGVNGQVAVALHYAMLSIEGVKMSDEVAEIEAKIRSLSTEEKAELIRALIADLDGPEEDGVEQAWLEEVERRHREMLDGIVQGIPGEQVFENLRSRLKR
jgi:putative addiction module component (TIGR02574 family)